MIHFETQNPLFSVIFETNGIADIQNDSWFKLCDFQPPLQIEKKIILCPRKSGPEKLQRNMVLLLLYNKIL